MTAEESAASARTHAEAEASGSFYASNSLSSFLLSFFQLVSCSCWVLTRLDGRLGRSIRHSSRTVVAGVGV